MNICALFALVISTIFGASHLLIAKTTDQGDELCDPDLFYASTRYCVLLWDRALMAFGVFFVIAAAAFVALALIWMVVRRGR